MGKNNQDPIDNEMIAKGKDIIKDFDVSKAVYVEPKHNTHKLISIRLPLNMIKNLRAIAQKRGDIGYQQVVKIYISEGLMKDSYQEIYQNISPKSYDIKSTKLTSSSICENYEYWGRRKWEVSKISTGRS